METKNNYENKIILPFFLILSLPSVLLAQPAWICGNTANSSSSNNTNQPPNCTYNSVAYNTRWGKQSNYVPNNTQPIITVKYALHIFDTTSQTSFAYKNNATDLARLNSINGAVKFYSRYSAARLGYTFPNFPPHISDSRVEYECVGIYFYYDDIMFKATQFGTFYNYVKTNFVDNNVDPTRLSDALPIFFTQGALGYAGIATSIGGDLDFSAPQGVLTTLGQTAGDWYANEHILHEIGHLMGWRHKYEDEYLDPNHPDFLSDVFLQNNPFCSSSNVWGTCYSPTCGNNFTPSNNCDNNVMSGQDNKWMSPLQMGRRRRVLSLASTRQYVKDLISDHVNVVNINSNETWDFDIQMYEDIVVKSGNTLKVTCKINMAREGRIIVEKGAQLIVDGGEITTWSKTGAWDGIYVEGSGSGTPQNLGFQGQVEVKNGGTITNAQVAINTFIKDASGNVNWATTGGMIFCDNANFINNIKDVQFMYYHGLAINNNVCTFKNTNFKITGPLKGGALPDSRVSMYEVNGVTFLGCNFENSTGSNIASENWGINSIDARYTIDKLGVTATTVKGFATGIRVENTNPLKLITVKNTTFENNLDNGIYINNTNNIILENNSFKMPSQVSTNPNPTPVFSNGIYLNNCKYYNVRNNNFSRNLTLPQVYQNVGITAHNSQNGGHHIYNNKYNSLDIGILALANNSGLTNSTDGLLMNCNDFTGLTNVYDIAIVEDQINGNNNSTFASVKVVQGNHLGQPNGYVRNRYGAPFLASNSETQFYIANVGKSYLHGTNPNSFCLPLPQPQLSDPLLNVIGGLIPFDLSQCPSDQFASSNPCTSCPIIFNLNSAISESQINYNTALSNYTASIDGGNTTTLVAAVNGNMSNGNLKNLLESKSPYLSDAALNAYFNKAATPPGHIKDIHALNAPVSPVVWQTIQNINLPPGIRNQITAKQNENKFSARDLLYAEVSQTHTRLQGAVSNKINYLATDTLPSSADSLISTLGINKGNMENAKEQLFFAHLNKEDYVNAEKTALDIELTQSATLGAYLKKLISIHTNPRKVDGILGTESNITYFNSIAQNKEIFANAGAKSLLKSFKGINYFEPRFLPQNNAAGSRLTPDLSDEKIKPLQQINVYPNPTNSNLMVVNTLTTEKSNLEIIISDAIGRKVLEKNLNSAASCELNLKDLQGGVYLLMVYQADQLIQTTKIVKLD